MTFDGENVERVVEEQDQRVTNTSRRVFHLSYGCVILMGNSITTGKYSNTTTTLWVQQEQKESDWESLCSCGGYRITMRETLRRVPCLWQRTPATTTTRERDHATRLIRGMGAERTEWQVTIQSGLIQGWISWLKARIRWENTRWMIKIQGNSSICVCVVSDTRTALLWINQLDCRLSLVWVNNMNTGGLFTCFCELNLPTDW